MDGGFEWDWVQEENATIVKTDCGRAVADCDGFAVSERCEAIERYRTLNVVISGVMSRITVLLCVMSLHLIDDSLRGS